MTQLLAGDIGGTKTHLALISPEQGARTPIAEKKFASDNYDNLETIIQTFLETTDHDIQSACFGIAGPIFQGKAEVTNLNWHVDSKALQAKFGLNHVAFLNDLESVANAIPFLGSNDLLTLNQGQPDPTGHIAVIAPGTGLGEAFLTWNGKRYVPHACEGGHTSFSPNNDLEVGLLQYLYQHQGHHHVSFERVCSGEYGIPNIYEYLHYLGLIKPSPDVAEKLIDAEDPTPIIVQAALDENQRCPLSEKTMEMFVSILGAAAGNMVMSYLSTGGVYLGGGIPPRIIPFLENGTFMKAFKNKGRFSELNSKVPVHIIINPNVGLLGASLFGLNRFANEK